MSLYDDPTGGETPDPNLPGAGPGGTAPTAPAPKRYNTTTMWQDPYNPPSPGDPYWDDWIAANPDYRGQGYNGPTTAPPPPTTAPPPPTTTGAPPPTTTTTRDPFPVTPTPPPTFTPPPYTPPPAERRPPAFSYADFVAPDPSELQNDPVYQHTLRTEQDAIQKSAAARGILNTGGTINDLLTNAQDVASQGYHDLWQRSYDTYNTNRQGALQDYTTNYGIDRNTYQDNYQTQYADPFNFTYRGAMDQYNANSHNYDQSQYYNQRNTELGQQYDWARTLFNYQQGQDDWEHKFRLLGLI